MMGNHTNQQIKWIAQIMLHSPFCSAPSQTNWLNQNFNVFDNLCFSGTVRAWTSTHLRLATSTSKVEDLLCCSCHSSKTFLLYCVAFRVALLWLNADYFQTVWQLHTHMMNMTNLIFWHDVLMSFKMARSLKCPQGAPTHFYLLHRLGKIFN